MSIAAKGWYVVALSWLLGCSAAGTTEEDVGTSTQELDPPFFPLPDPDPIPPHPIPLLPIVTTLASGVRPTSIALSSTNVYFSNAFSLFQEVDSIPLGGGVKTVLHSTAARPLSLVFFGSTLYWLDAIGAGPDGGIWSISTSAGSMPVHVTNNHDDVNLNGQPLAVYSTGSGILRMTHIMFGDAWASKLYDTRLSLFGTSQVSLLPDFDPVTHFNYYPYSIAIDGTHVYFTHDTGGGIWRVPYAGGTPTKLVDAAERESVVVEGGQMYFVKGGDIRSKPSAGGVSTTFASSVGTVVSMVAANGNLYWACSSCNAIYKKPLAGGAKVTLASAETNLLSLAVNSSYVYWGTTTALKRVLN